jgi:hypothetical protein
MGEHWTGTAVVVNLSLTGFRYLAGPGVMHFRYPSAMVGAVAMEKKGTGSSFPLSARTRHIGTMAGRRETLWDS